MNAQLYLPFRSAAIIGPQRTTLEFPVFTTAAKEWSGASSIVLEFPVNNDYAFSIRKPINQFGQNFILAVRWVEDGVTHRLKFWSGGVLYFPIYSGERIGKNAIFEIWSTDYEGGSSSPEVFTVETSLFIYPSSFGCTNLFSSTTLVARDPITLLEYDDPFGQDPPAPPEEGEPGGGWPTVEQLPGDFFIFPTSGFGIEANGVIDYPSMVTQAQANFWQQLLDNVWNVTSFSERHLAWWFPNHIVNLNDFLVKYATGVPVHDPFTDELVEFEAPWILTYLWKP